MSFRPLTLGAVASLALLGCPEPKKADPTPVVPPAPPTRTGAVTVLVTGHETGALPTRGARLLAQWRAEEGWPDALAFSTGDTFAGAAISSIFDGQPTAEVMKALQYKAAAFGNHELDLGLNTFLQFREASGLTVLAANLADKSGAEVPLKLQPSALFTREGVKVGVIGFTSPKTITTTSGSGKAAGLELLPLEASVGPALDSLKKDAPDVVIALIDDCFQVLKPVLDAHPEWKVNLVVGSRCAEGAQEDVGGATRYFSTGDDLTHYVAARFELKADQVVMTRAARKDVTKGDEDADLVALRTRWQAKANEALGEKLGFTKAGFKEDAAELRTLVAVAMRDRSHADAAIINKKGVRAALPPGPITRASVYDLIPFENAMLTVKLKGEVLQKLKSEPNGFVVAPAKLEADKEYLVATTEYIYFGGDGLGLEQVASAPEFTGQVWQTPVVEWLREHPSTEKKPLDAQLKALK